MRHVAAVALVLASVVSAQAQEIVAVTDIPTSQRQGSFTSTSYTVPVDATGYVRVRADMASAEYENTANSLVIRMYVLGGDNVWRVSMGVKWIGGRMEDPELGVNPMPSISTNLVEFRGKTVRLEMEVPVRMRVGAVIETSPDPFY